MNTTLKKTFLVAGGLVLVAAVLMARQHFSTTVRESYFEPDGDKLRQVPAGITVLRPTRFPLSFGRIRHIRNSHDEMTASVGRNATLRQVMAEAYDCDTTRVMLPADAPKDRFDFLVTVPQTRKHLRSLISRQLGLTAHTDTRDITILELTVADPSLPGFTLSPDTEDSDVKFKDGRLYFQHQSLSLLRKGLEDGLGQAVVDATGCTNCYDFSIAWSEAAGRAMEKASFNPDKVQEFLRNCGLRLEPVTTNMEVCVVAKAG